VLSALLMIAIRTVGVVIRSLQAGADVDFAGLAGRGRAGDFARHCL
jgi:hypothetical protein